MQTLSLAEIEAVSGADGLIPISFDLASLPSSNMPNFGDFSTQTLYGIGYESGNLKFGIGLSSDFNTVGGTISWSF